MEMIFLLIGRKITPDFLILIPLLFFQLISNCLSGKVTGFKRNLRENQGNLTHSYDCYVPLLGMIRGQTIVPSF
jgi:hypothetical protein